MKTEHAGRRGGRRFSQHFAVVSQILRCLVLLLPEEHQRAFPLCASPQCFISGASDMRGSEDSFASRNRSETDCGSICYFSFLVSHPHWDFLVSIRSDMGGVWASECTCLALLVEVVGELRVGALAFAPHVADPRLSEMRCGWKPGKTSYCGRVGKVIQVGRFAVKLYSCGNKLWWDIQLFDSCLKRYCHKGCSLQYGVVASPQGFICAVCLARIPVGAPIASCDGHGYFICTYCLGKPSVPAVGERVIRGPTWSSHLQLKGDEDYYEEGIVETALLDGIGLARADDSIEMPKHSHHSYFQASCRSGPHNHGFGLFCFCA